jgi:membrane protein
VTLGFRFYVQNFGSYNKTYGTIGGVIVLLTWMYLSMVVLLIGGELAASCRRGRARSARARATCTTGASPPAGPPTAPRSTSSSRCRRPPQGAPERGRPAPSPAPVPVYGARAPRAD